jgi:hypothetical protein
MANVPGAYSGVKTLAEIGILPGNSGTANTAAWNTAVGDSGPPLTILGDTASPIPFAGPCRWPVTRSVMFDGREVANLHQQTGGAPVFQFFFDGEPSDWQTHRATIRDATLTAGAGGAACISTDNTGDHYCRFHRIHLSGLDLWTSPASTAAPGYGIDLVANYSVMPTVERCEAFFGGLLRWRPGNLEPHATSTLRVVQCRAHVAASMRYAPDYWLDGHRNLLFQGNIAEGGWGFAPGVDGVALYDGATGVLIDNPGPQTTVISQLWSENWGTRSNPDWHQTVIRNPFPGSAGAHQPRSVYLFACNGFVLVKNHPTSLDPMTVYSEKSPGMTLATSGLVDAIERDAHEIRDTSKAESGNRFESPVGLGRLEPVSQPLYVYAGGTGNDGNLTRGTGLLYPHRHPVYGPCLAFRGTGTGFVLPVGRRPGPGRLFFAIKAASPHHVRRGGGADGLWARFGTAGIDQFRQVPDGFAPAVLHPLSLPVAGGESVLLQFADWRSAMYGGTYQQPPSPWLLVYGAALSAVRPHPLEPARPGVVSGFEWTPGGGPPPGTYEFGDRVLTLNGGLPHICSAPGTGRTLSLTCNTTAGSPVLTGLSAVEELLEGDYVSLPGVSRARVLAIAADGTVTLNMPAATTATGAALTNCPPQFARRRV